jgi:hypothetical protein
MMQSRQNGADEEGHRRSRVWSGVNIMEDFWEFTQCGTSCVWFLGPDLDVEDMAKESEGVCVDRAQC